MSVDSRGGRVVRWHMRPLSAALALAYTLAFVVACLGGCLSSDPGAHSCCQSESGFANVSAGKDCCKVVPSTSGKLFVAEPLLDQTQAPESAVMCLGTVPRQATPTPAAAGPPLILRI